VVEAIHAVHEKPERLADEVLAAAPVTLLHGDFRIGSIGLDGQRVVAIDWGELTGLGPAEVELAWLASVRGRRLTWTPDNLFEPYNGQATRRLDRRAHDRACIGALALQGGWYCALSVRDDETWRAYDQEQLA
jgi:aminoglycoside phosphotransferase (APT) family kinase protein